MFFEVVLLSSFLPLKNRFSFVFEDAAISDEEFLPKCR